MIDNLGSDTFYDWRLPIYELAALAVKVELMMLMLSNFFDKKDV